MCSWSFQPLEVEGKIRSLSSFQSVPSFISHREVVVSFTVFPVLVSFLNHIYYESGKRGRVM